MVLKNASARLQSVCMALGSQLVGQSRIREYDFKNYSVNMPFRESARTLWLLRIGLTLWNLSIWLYEICQYGSRKSSWL